MEEVARNGDKLWYIKKLPGSLNHINFSIATEFTISKNVLGPYFDRFTSGNVEYLPFGNPLPL